VPFTDASSASRTRIVVRPSTAGSAVLRSNGAIAAVPSRAGMSAARSAPSA